MKIPPEEVIITFLLLPFANHKDDVGKAATPPASSLQAMPALHTIGQGPET